MNKINLTRFYVTLNILFFKKKIVHADNLNFKRISEMSGAVENGTSASERNEATNSKMEEKERRVIKGNQMEVIGSRGAS